MAPRHAITREKRDRMLTALRGGALYRDAAEAAGIPWSTWCDWSRKAREGVPSDDDVAALVEAARQAYHAANVGLEATVAKAAAKDWRAAVALLQHRQGDPHAQSKRRLERLQADLAELQLDERRKGGAGSPTIVIELPASLARPREG